MAVGEFLLLLLLHNVKLLMSLMLLLLLLLCLWHLQQCLSHHNPCHRLQVRQQIQW
jgi:hypothetical protein